VNDVQRIRLRFSADQRTVALVAATLEMNKFRLELYDSETGTRQGGPYSLSSFRMAIPHVISQDHVLVRGQKGAIVDWEPKSGHIRLVSGGSSSSTALLAPVVAAIDRGSILAIPDVSGGVIRLLRWPHLAEVRSWPYQGSASKLAFSRDGASLVAASADGAMRIWNTSTGEELSRIYAAEPLIDVAFSTDGRRLIAVSRMNVMRYLWKVEDLTAEVCRLADRNLSQQEWDQYVPKDYGTTGMSSRCVCPDRPCP
jgi:WD40 repeat protein